MGLIPALREYTAGFAQRTGVVINVTLPEQKFRIPKDIEDAVFRTVQEGLTNIYRHSGSRTAILRLTIQARAVALELVDHGRGFPTKSKAEMAPAGRIGVGIVGMRERARQLGGRLAITSDPGGTTLRLTLPLAAHNEPLSSSARA